MNSQYYDINFNRVGFAIGIIGASVTAGMAGATIGIVYQKYKKLTDFFAPRTERINTANNFELYDNDRFNVHNDEIHIITDNNNINLNNNNNFNPQNLNLREINNIHQVTGVNLNNLANPNNINQEVCKNLHDQIVNQISQNPGFSISTGVPEINTKPITTKLDTLLTNTDVMLWSEVYDSMINVTMEYYKNYVSNNLQINPFYNRISNINQNNNIINTNINSINNINDGVLIENTSSEYSIRQALYGEYMRINREIRSIESNNINNNINNIFGNDIGGEIRNQFLNRNVSVSDLESTLDQLRHVLEGLRIRSGYYGDIFRVHDSSQFKLGPALKDDRIFIGDRVFLSSDRGFVNFIVRQGNPYDYCFNLPSVFKNIQGKRNVLLDQFSFLKKIDKKRFDEIVAKLTKGWENLNEEDPFGRLISSLDDKDCEIFYYKTFNMLKDKRNNTNILKEQNNAIFNTLKSSYIRVDAKYYFNTLQPADQKIVFDYFLKRCNKLINVSGSAEMKKDLIKLNSQYKVNNTFDSSTFMKVYELYHNLVEAYGYLNPSYLDLDYDDLSNEQMFDLIVECLPYINRHAKHFKGYYTDIPGGIHYYWPHTISFDFPQTLSILTKWNKELDYNSKSELFEYLLDIIQMEFRLKNILSYIEDNINQPLNKEILLKYPEIYEDIAGSLNAHLGNLMKVYKDYYLSFGHLASSNTIECLVNIHNYFVKNQKVDILLDEIKKDLKTIGYDIDALNNINDNDWRTILTIDNYMKNADKTNKYYKYFEILDILGEKALDLDPLDRVESIKDRLPGFYSFVTEGSEFNVIKSFFNDDSDLINRYIARCAKKYYLFNDHISFDKDDDESDDNIINTNSKKDNKNNIIIFDKKDKSENKNTNSINKKDKSIIDSKNNKDNIINKKDEDKEDEKDNIINEKDDDKEDESENENTNSINKKDKSIIDSKNNKDNIINKKDEDKEDEKDNENNNIINYDGNEINVFAPENWGSNQKKAMIKKVIEKISTRFNTKWNISNINVKYDKINKKYNVTVMYKKIIKKTIRFNPKTGKKNPDKSVITKMKYNLTLEPDELNDNIINFNEKDEGDNKNNDINTDLKNKKDNINTYPHSFSFDNIHYYSNIVINESYLIRECIHKDITEYIQKNGKDIDPKNPPKEFNITVKITTLKDRHDFEFERWELSVTYAPNEHSPLNTIQLKYYLEDTIFGKCVCNDKES